MGEDSRQVLDGAVERTTPKAGAIPPGESSDAGSGREHDHDEPVQASSAEPPVPEEHGMSLTLAEHLKAHSDLHRNLQDNLGEALSGLGLDDGETQLRAETYDLGIRVGATETLRMVVPRLAETLPENGCPPDDQNEWLRMLLCELRLALGELVGDDE